MPFRTIVGHRRLLSLLSRAIARETLPPALLLAGPAGVGKRRVAVAIAETLNTAGLRNVLRESPDVILIESGDMGSIKIEQVRDVIDRAEYRPFEGRRRVVIIDEADALMTPAQSALLKTL